MGFGADADMFVLHELLIIIFGPIAIYLRREAIITSRKEILFIFFIFIYTFYSLLRKENPFFCFSFSYKLMLIFLRFPNIASNSSKIASDIVVPFSVL